MHDTTLDRVQTALRSVLYLLTIGVYGAFAALTLLVFFGFMMAIFAG
jgi:hypothetical protein